jgi:glycosyltransferase involved in cell wall biosynthesis
MARVLLFYPPNKRSVAIETLCRTVKDAGHDLIVLTLTERGSFHEALDRYSIETFIFPPIAKGAWKYRKFYKQSQYLVRFCKENNITHVWSHLQEANIISLMAQRNLNAKLVLFRHHAESAFYAEFGKKMHLKRSKGEIVLDRIINRFSKTIVVPSSGVWYGMEKYEKCDMRKVKLLPYIYDFSSYAKPDMEKVNQLRRDHSCQLMLIMISRMVISKQHLPVFEVIKKLVGEGLDIKMIVMDDGPLRPELEGYITSNKLEKNFVLTGYREDFINYMMCADLLMHPSVTEASNNVVKEMALLEKGVAVCKNVGDFNDYIKENENGYFLKTDNLLSTLESVVQDAYKNPDKLRQMGIQLKQDVLRHFSDTRENRQRFLDLLK